MSIPSVVNVFPDIVFVCGREGDGAFTETTKSRTIALGLEELILLDERTELALADSEAHLLVAAVDAIVEVADVEQGVVLAERAEGREEYAVVDCVEILVSVLDFALACGLV